MVYFVYRAEYDMIQVNKTRKRGKASKNRLPYCRTRLIAPTGGGGL